jgi:hypothetical protein
MRKYIINMLLTIVIGTTAQAQVPVITTHPQSVAVCAGSPATFIVAATNNPTSYTWQYSFNDGETWDVASGVQSFQAFQITILPPSINRVLVRSIANNASGSSEPSAAAVLTIIKATDSLYIVKPNTTPTCVGNSFLLAGSQANGVFSSSNSNIATVNCNGVVNIKAQGISNINYVYTGTNGCKDTAQFALNSNTPTPATINGATSLCVGANTTYTANINNGVWSSNGRLSINATSGVATATSAGTTKVNYTIIGENGCTAKTEFTATVNALPPIPNIAYQQGTPSPQSGSNFCRSRAFILVGFPAGGTWSAGGVASVNTSGTVTLGVNIGTASVTYTSTNANGCSNSRTISSTVVACASRGTATNELQETKNHLTIYPNPAHSFIRLNIDNLIGNGSIFITDLYGKSLKTQSLSLGTNTIDIAALARGIYFANITINNTKQVQKIVVE